MVPSISEMCRLRYMTKEEQTELIGSLYPVEPRQLSYHTVIPFALAALSRDPLRVRVSSSVSTTISGLEPRAQIEF
jgi:hypothetical protein